ncbi:MAG TPA: aspartate--tRNA ligase [Candidatus Paceibacterota bacterium]|nr:aspartate--tRNA ligase [Candidatus Paceibacterota bacterium]
MSRTLTREIANREGEEVELKGWVDSRRDHGGLIFIDLRDMSGVVQVVFNPKKYPESHKAAEKLRTAFVIGVTGEVNKRPKGMENPKIPSGDYEVLAKELEVINETHATLPIATDGDGYDIGEEVRMKYRYLDLRRPRMQKNIRNRAKAIKFIRDYLTERDFTEIETPILSKSTPEGARDYVVPSRVHAGKFYALPQSPQQYKQLLMVAGIERYFQIARCFRDEDTRGDRQPEFTQLDLEMSFVSQDDVLELTEDLFTALVEKLYPDKKITEKPFPRISYEEAIEKYGTDKPDLRKEKDDPNELAFAFVINFPMFEKKDDGTYGAVHHPFTMPRVENVADFKSSFRKNPLSMIANQYDFVLNGYEVGGGSIRIHDPELLQAVFEALGNEPEKVKEDFGHIFEAFGYGVPPHGGIAPGIDRLMMILENEPNIREVTAFPKTGDGRDPMMKAPSGLTNEQLKELHLKVESKEKRT